MINEQHSMNRFGLGELIVADQIRLSSQNTKIWGMIFFFLVALAALVSLLSSNHLSGQEFVRAYLPFIVISIAMPVLMGGFLLYSAMNGRKERIEVYENGIVRAYGEKRMTWKWNELSGLRLLQLTMTTNYRLYGIVPIGSSTRSDFKATFYDLNHKTVLKLSKSYPKHTEIGSAVVRGFSPVLLQRHMKAYRNGEVIEYGDIQINRAGLQKQGVMGKSTLRWDEILQLWVENATLHIRKSNGMTVSYGINDRVNGFVLPQFVSQITASQGR